MLRTLRRFSALFALLAYVLALPEGVLVLCMGDGQHRAIEAACLDHSAESSSPAAFAEPCACDDPCGPCEDAPLGLDHSALQSLAQRESVAPAPLAVSPSPGASDLVTPLAATADALAPATSPPSGLPPQSPLVLRI